MKRTSHTRNGNPVAVDRDAGGRFAFPRPALSAGAHLAPRPAYEAYRSIDGPGAVNADTYTAQLARRRERARQGRNDKIKANARRWGF